MTSSKKSLLNLWLLFVLIIGVLALLLYGAWRFRPQLDDSQVEAYRRLHPAVVMQRCVAEWKAQAFADGFAEGLGMEFALPGRAERHCADMHGLYKQDGNWQRKVPESSTTKK